MKKGYIGQEENGQIIDEEEFTDFDISENSNWQMLPWTEGMETQIYNCMKTNSPGDDYSFDKITCKWISSN